MRFLGRLLPLVAIVASTSAVDAQTLNTTTTFNGTSGSYSGVLTIDSNGGQTPTLYLLNGATQTAGLSVVFVGNQYTGALSLQGASTLSNSGIAILANFEGTSTGTATVAGGSRWTSGGNLLVGGGGNGFLNINSGGVVSNSNGFIAYGQGFNGQNVSTGTALVGGVGSTWNNNRLFVGGNLNNAGGTGSLNVSSGGAVNVSETLKIYSAGTVTLDGGTITARSVDRTSGTLNLNGGTLTTSGGKYTQPAGMLTIAGANGPTFRLTNGATVDGVQGVTAGAAAGNGALAIESGSVFEMTGYSGTLGLTAGSTGTATVRDAGSQWNLTALRVGVQGQGSLDVLHGGAMSIYSSLGIGGESGAGVVTVSGAGSQINFGSISALNIAELGQGTLAVLHGGQVSVGRSTIGVSYGSDGTTTIDGTGSLLAVTNTLAVGGGGTGALSILNHGSATAGFVSIGNGEGSVGTATVGGSGSQLSVDNFLFVGQESRGQLNIVDGGQVTVGSAVSVGVSGLYSGTLVVSGTGSQLTTNSILRIGDGAQATLTVANGGTVSASRAVIAGVYNQSAVQAATIDGTGSLFAVTNTLSVGGGSSGQLTIQNHGRATAAQVLLGDQEGSSGTLNVVGAGSQLAVVNNLTVGNVSRGALHILDGGHVSNNNGFVAAPGSLYPAIVTVGGTGSTWTNTGGLYIGGNAASAGGTGTLNINAGGTVAVGGLTKIWSAGTVHIAAGGTLQTGSFQVVDGGTFTVDDGGTFSSGTVQTAGDFTLNGSVSGNVAVQGNNAAFTLNGSVTGDVAVTGNAADFVLHGSVTGNVAVEGTGAAFVNNGTVTGNVATSADTTLGGSGVVTGAISGAGLVGPGNSPGILTASQVDPTSGLDFLFQFTTANTPPTYGSPTNSLNDVLHLTHATDPFMSSIFSASNTITIDFEVGSLVDGQYYLGAFYTNLPGVDFVGNGTFDYADFQYRLNGTPLDLGHWQVSVSSLAQPGVDFGAGPTDGRVMKFQITDISSVPEPGSLILCGTAAAGYYLRRRKTKRTKNPSEPRP
jgi:fibronectin-binding autotransporter adhesin